MMAEDDLEKRKRRALGVPGREDEASLYPPIGRIPFDRIRDMKEDELDARIALHLQGDGMFRPGMYFKNERRGAFRRRDSVNVPPNRTDMDKRVLELKRVGLAILEGYSSRGRALSEWFRNEDDETSAEIQDPAALIDVLISRHGSSGYKDRRREIRKILKDVELFVPTKENEALLKQINTVIQRSGRRPLELHEIFTDRVTRLRADDINATSTTRRWSVHDILTLYLCLLRGLNYETIAKRFRSYEGSAGSFSAIIARSLSPKAKSFLPPAGRRKGMSQ